MNDTSSAIARLERPRRGDRRPAARGVADWMGRARVDAARRRGGARRDGRDNPAHRAREVHIRRAWARARGCSARGGIAAARLGVRAAGESDRPGLRPRGARPSEYVEEQAHVSSAAHQAWKEARAQSKYATFQPHLEKVVRLAQQYAGFFQPVAHPYDALIDPYEPGMSDVGDSGDLRRASSAASGAGTRDSGAAGRAGPLHDGGLRRTRDAGVLDRGDFGLRVRLDPRPAG